ncbi:hypothetical protein [Serinibacter arcticus]|uniref:DUF4439 domain-containing protein n=1 Tax=Serinibacter arcticus TaxID=1655435 RepID=A0A4Z1E659_9MICO|nr:hypothetical protein [Serinibacter arcticus]TGO05923.1 hypothetical protein SERN_0115 [Serinibacter arcticus]
MPRSASFLTRPPRTGRHDGLAPGRASVTLAACVAVLVGLTSGCGVRLEQPEPPPVTADAAETARAGAVSDAEAIATAATAAQSDPAAASVVDRLQQIAAASAAHAQDLGGEWAGASGAAADPASETDGTADPSVAPPVTDLVGTVALLVTGYDDARSDLAQVPGSTATVLASVALWRALAAHEVVGTTGVAPAAPLPTGGTDTNALRLATFRDVDALVRGLDAAAYAYEVLAARDGDDARQTDWNRRAATLRRTAELLAARAGSTGGEADPREAIYDVGPLLDGDPVAAAIALETEVASLWVTSALPAASRTVGLDAALEALLRARALGATGPLDSPAVVLPGLPGPAASTD